MKLVLRRIASSAVTLVACSMVVFAFRYLLPGGPGEEVLVSSQFVSQADAKAFLKMTDARFGLNRPLYVQFYHWVTGLIHGNLGYSFQSSEPVTTILGQRLAPSLELILGALFVALTVGGLLGIYSAIRRERPIGRTILIVSGLQISVPDFWIATINAAVFGLTLKIFPAVGFTPLSAGIGANLHTMILPILTLAVVPTAFITRHLHNAFAQTLKSPYVRTAWAMGLPSRRVYFTWALRNALAPIITFIPLLFAALIGGTVLVEYIFNIPGIGSEIVTSVANQDYPVTQGIVILAGFLIAVLNLLADITLSIVDPRIAQGSAPANTRAGRAAQLPWRRWVDRKLMIGARRGTQSEAVGPDGALAAAPTLAVSANGSTQIPVRPVPSAGPAFDRPRGAVDADDREVNLNKLRLEARAPVNAAGTQGSSVQGDVTLDRARVETDVPRRDWSRAWLASHWKRFPLHSRVGLGVTLVLLLAGFLAPLLPLQSPLTGNVSLVNAAPSLHHFFGTDYVGRDLFSRIIFGARSSYEGVVVGILVALCLGVLWGLTAGFGGPVIDELLMRVADAVLSFPGILLAIGLISVIGPSLDHAMIAIGFTDAPGIARLLRSQILPNKRAEFVLISGSLGASRARVAFRHVLPNALGPVLVQGFALCGIYLIVGAALSFLGLGVQAPAPSWGGDLAGAYQYFVNNPFGTVVPGLAITVAAWAISAFGDGVREAAVLN